MSDVNNRYVIDQIAVEDEKLVLIIVDPMEWGYCVRESHAHTLKDKISDYLQLICLLKYIFISSHIIRCTELYNTLII